MRKLITALIFAGAVCVTSNPYLPETPSCAAETLFEAVSIWDGSIDTSWYSADQAELHINTAAQLAGIGELLENGTSMLGQTIILDADLVLNDISAYDKWASTPPANEWEEIGNPIRFPFEGTFDGGGHTITGMYGNGIFGGISENSCIRNLHLDYAFLDVRSSGYNGGIVMCCKGGTIMGCSVEGTSSRKWAFSNTDYTGGICGLLQGGSITDCRVSGEMNFTSTSASDVFAHAYIGGICGRSESGIIRRCGSEMAISYTGSYYMKIGGICGEVVLDGAVIEDCFCRADIIAQNAREDGCGAGGIAGLVNYGVTLKNCYPIGAVDARTRTGYLGGIVGHYGGDQISNTYHVGMVRSQSHEGGLVGTCWEEDVLEHCYYLAEDAERGVGETRVSDKGTAESMEYLQSEEFAAVLGESFVYNEGSYPLLAWELGGSEMLMGDVNEDGTLSVLDVILLQKVLLGREKLTETGGKLADLAADSAVDGFDLAVLKRRLLDPDMVK